MRDSTITGTISWGKRARTGLAIAATPAIAAGLLIAQLTGPAGAATHRYTAVRECDASKQACRPECVTAVLSTPAGKAWIKVCGTGSGGETPLRERSWVRSLILDGSRVIDHHSCTHAAPCVILAPNSPAS